MPWEANLTHLKPKTRHDMLAVWRNHVAPKWSGRQMSGIKPSEVQAWVSSLDRSASLVRQAHAVLAQILDLAVMDKAVRENPARGVKLPRKGAVRKVYLTAEQLGLLVGECTRYRELVWLLGTVGLRWGEAAALRVRDTSMCYGTASASSVTRPLWVVRWLLGLLRPMRCGKWPYPCL